VGGGVGKLGVLVSEAKVAAGAVRVTVFSGAELQATIDTVNKIKQSNLNGIFIISISMLVEKIITPPASALTQCSFLFSRNTIPVNEGYWRNRREGIIAFCWN
jgi:hypothetical protein